MPLTAFVAGTLYTPASIPNGVVVVEDGRIREVAAREAIDLPQGAREVRLDEGIITPGFVDTHNHGAGGRDVMEASRESLDVICRTLARFGTTSYYPTTLTAPEADIRRAFECLADYVQESEARPRPMAQPLGIHMEGPYLSVTRRGVHPAEHLVEPTLDAYRKLAEAAGGQLRIVTLAPELARAAELIEEMLKTRVQPSMGHTDSTYEQAKKAVELGVRRATHVFNAMRPFRHRDPGVIGAVLEEASVTAELIADGVHVDPVAIRLLYRCKGRDGIALISDGLSATGMPPGEYSVGGLTVEARDGACYYSDRLAGSVLTLDRAVRNMRDFLHLPLEEVIQMATLNPARMIGIDDRKGCLQAGADADLVLMDSDLNVRQVYARGLPVE